MYGFPDTVQLLSEDTQVETQSNNIDTIHNEFPWLWVVGLD